MAFEVEKCVVLSSEPNLPSISKEPGFESITSNHYAGHRLTRSHLQASRQVLLFAVAPQLSFHSSRQCQLLTVLRPNKV